jgi:hypothetical protein
MEVRLNFESCPIATVGQELLLELAGKVHGATIADLCEKAEVTFRRSLADSVGVTVAAF